MKNLLYILLGVVLFATQACQDNKHTRLYNAKTLVDGEGLYFIRTGMEAGLTEIKAAKVAETNSKDPRIISFAKMMIADHSKAGDELKKIELDQNLTIGADAINATHKQKIDSLATKSGAEFDKAYLEMMVDDHKEAVKLFEDATHDKNSTVKSFSIKVLPTIKMHLDNAEKLYASLK